MPPDALKLPVRPNDGHRHTSTGLRPDDNCEKDGRARRSSRSAVADVALVNGARRLEILGDARSPKDKAMHSLDQLASPKIKIFKI